MPTVRAELSAITPHPALFYIKTRYEWQLAAARSGGTALARARVASAERREANSLSQRASCSRFFFRLPGRRPRAQPAALRRPVASGGPNHHATGVFR